MSLTIEGRKLAYEALANTPLVPGDPDSIEERLKIARTLVFGSSGDGRLPGGVEVTDALMKEITDNNSIT